MQYDQIIIGSGLSGLFSAYLLAKGGQRVCVISKGSGSLYLSSGYIDKLAYVGEEKTNDISKLSGHPYNLVGEKAVAEAFDAFLQLTKEIGMPYTGSVDENRYFPTAIGTLRPTCLYPQSMDKNIVEERDIEVVGIKECVDFYPKMVAEGLQRSLSQSRILHSSISLEIETSTSQNTYDAATLIDAEKNGFRLIEALKVLDLKGKLVIFPPVLSLSRHAELVAEIESTYSCRVLEATSMPPAVPGMRIYHALEKKLKDMGVKILNGIKVDKAIKEDGKIKSIIITTVAGREKEYSAKEFIAATGGALAGGIVVGIDGIYEPLFGLEVDAPERERLMETMFTNKPQGLSTAGVTVDSAMKTEIENLYAVGALVKGADPFVEKSGNGIALATSYRAAKSILEARNA